MAKVELTPRARRLRINQTGVERLLWSKLRNRRLGGWKWKRQLPRGPYIADFACVEANVIVELDGGHIRIRSNTTPAGAIFSKAKASPF